MEKDYQFSFIYRCQHSSQEQDIVTKIYNSDRRYNLVNIVEHRYYNNLECGGWLEVIYYCKKCKESKKIFSYNK